LMHQMITAVGFAPAAKTINRAHQSRMSLAMLTLNTAKHAGPARILTFFPLAGAFGAPLDRERAPIDAAALRSKRCRARGARR
jgi:hypothetical protein